MLAKRMEAFCLEMSVDAAEFIRSGKLPSTVNSFYRGRFMAYANVVDMLRGDALGTTKERLK